MRFLVLLCLLLSVGSASSNTPPEITHLWAQQRDDGSGLVDVTYDVVDADGDELKVSMFITTVYGFILCDCATVTGDIGDGILPGSNRRITWDAGLDCPGQYDDDLIVRLHADDGSPSAGFVRIAAGTYLMGSPETEVDRNADEILHEVTLTHDFYLQSTEVTNRQYAEMAQWAYDQGYVSASSDVLWDLFDENVNNLLEMESSGCEIYFSGGTFHVDEGKEDQPVKEVTWYGAAAYCNWLNMREGYWRIYAPPVWQLQGNNPYDTPCFRLPTEAEWEYACRAGTQTPFYTGECLDADVEANYLGISPYSSCPAGSYEGSTVEVGTYPANGLGLYDMHGNVMEWCNDGYGSYTGPVTDPIGVIGPRHVFRGGSWGSSGKYCRSAQRASAYGHTHSPSLGFRVCRTAD